MRSLFLTVLVLAATATCVRLGFWQLERMRYKHAIHAAQRALLAEPPLELRSALSATPPETGRRVHVHGRSDPSAEILLSGREHQGAPGVSWVRGIRLESGACVLVEIGWLPSDDGRTQVTPTDPGVVEPVDFVGVALPLERSSHPLPWAELSSQRAGTRLWSARTLEADSVSARFPGALAPWMVRALPAGTPPDGAPIPEDFVVPDEAMHLSYAIQWFGFAAIISLGSLALALRRKA